MNGSKSLTSGITSENGINYLNIGLMFLSLVAAYILPFEVFLFSYAVLGPLHYLTEISWLEKKSYFVKSKKDIWLFVVLVILITIGMFNGESRINLFLGSILFSGFIYALIILFVEKLALKLLLIFLTFIVSLIFNVNHYPDAIFLLFAVWLPTIIHVFVFTGAFILYGALKTKSTSGMISLAVFILCAICFFIYTPAGLPSTVTEYARKAYYNFKILNTTLYSLFGYGEMSIRDQAMFSNENSVKIMRFIAFAYTYHYLNWFSKTSVIKWNQVSKTRMSVIVCLWILSVVLYAVSYEIGFYALFLLSLLHVFFEFPLNHHTFIGIGKELKAMVRK
ncbi:MAG: hypothetical protein JWO44_1970 [Bacteroidetes bacterium]|jgi:hypothetical protein|nr:hypothetical protein [Bacteroidota bacterium]